MLPQAKSLSAVILGTKLCPLAMRLRKPLPLKILTKIQIAGAGNPCEDAALPIEDSAGGDGPSRPKRQRRASSSGPVAKRRT